MNLKTKKPTKLEVVESVVASVLVIQLTKGFMCESRNAITIWWHNQYDSKCAYKYRQFDVTCHPERSEG